MAGLLKLRCSFLCWYLFFILAYSNVFEFSAAILEKGLFSLFTLIHTTLIYRNEKKKKGKKQLKLSLPLTSFFFNSQTNISFIENSSMVKGAAIYVSSLQRCVWTKEIPHRDFKKALRWSGNIKYERNFLFTEALSGSAYDIATDTERFHLHSTKDNSIVKVMALEVFFISLVVQHFFIHFPFFRLFIQSYMMHAFSS